MVRGWAEYCTSLPPNYALPQQNPLPRCQHDLVNALFVEPPVPQKVPSYSQRIVVPASYRWQVAGYQNRCGELLAPSS
jgi:hypothetical protein